MRASPDSQEEPGSQVCAEPINGTSSSTGMPYGPLLISSQSPNYTYQASLITVPLPEAAQNVQQRITIRLPDSSARITRQLSMPNSHTALRSPMVIPATERRWPISSSKQPRRRRFLMHVGVLMSSIAILALVALVVAPLDAGQQQQVIVQGIQHLITTGPLNSFTTSQHLAAPASTPNLLSNKGNCGGNDIWGVCAGDSTDGSVIGTGQMQPPMQGEIITQVFAHPEYQQWCGCWRPHTGIDLAAPYGTAVMAADSGEVIWTGWDWSGLGWAVKISHGHDIATIYGHLARYIVRVGQSVTKGQIIAYEGSTGASTGPHVHFMVLINNIWVNPADYVALP